MVVSSPNNGCKMWTLIVIIKGNYCDSRSFMQNLDRFITEESIVIDSLFVNQICSSCQCGVEEMSSRISVFLFLTQSVVQAHFLAMSCTSILAYPYSSVIQAHFAAISSSSVVKAHILAIPDSPVVQAHILAITYFPVVQAYILAITDSPVLQVYILGIPDSPVMLAYILARLMALDIFYGLACTGSKVAYPDPHYSPVASTFV